MILFLAATASMIALDLTGMPPQISEIRAVAAQHQLKLLCNGAYGRQMVIRVGIPGDRPTQEYVDLRKEFDSIASQSLELGNMNSEPNHCDYTPSESHTEIRPFADQSLEPAFRDLTWAPAEELQKFLPVAISCGFTHAFIRPLNEIDRRFIGMAGNAPKVEPDWHVLDAGERLADHDGPISCVLKLFRRTALRDEQGR